MSHESMTPQGRDAVAILRSAISRSYEAFDRIVFTDDKQALGAALQTVDLLFRVVSWEHDNQYG